MNGRKGRRRLLQPYPKHSPIITPMTYKAVIIPQPIITPLPPAVAYLIGALGVKHSGCLFGISSLVILIHLRFVTFFIYNVKLFTFQRNYLLLDHQLSLE